jgi:hypothetical protein
MSANQTDPTAETYQEGTTPVQVFASPVIPAPTGDLALTRRGRPSRGAAGDKQEGENATEQDNGVGAVLPHSS